MENSNIAWCDSTWNPWEGCTKVSPGCAHCYAETRNARWNKGTAVNWGPGAPRRRTSEANWKLPVKWNLTAEAEVPRQILRRPRIFCASLADWLDDEVPIEWLADLLNLIRLTPNLDWLMLSKRLQNWNRIEQAGVSVSETNIPLWGWIGDWVILRKFPANVWIGTTVENQEMADKRIPQLLDIPARVRFLSCEPLLGRVNLDVPVMQGSTFIVGDEGGYEYVGSNRQMLDWVICGGESGHGARPMNPAWARSLRDQCAEAQVPFFMKQQGGHPNKLDQLSDLPEDLRIRQFPS